MPFQNILALLGHHTFAANRSKELGEQKLCILKLAFSLLSAHKLIALWITFIICPFIH